MNQGKLIKVCGMRETENIRATEQLGVDMIGFIFYPKSPRYVYELPAYLPTRARRVGVFVNEEKQMVQMFADRFGLDYIQLHGHESPEYCRSLHASGARLIKTFSIARERDLLGTSEYEDSCDYFLFDTKCEQHGGSGNQFDWSLLNAYEGRTPFLLSGGINSYSARALKEFHHPQLAGYDINSRFERQPGEKDVERIATFLRELNPPIHTQPMNRINQLFGNQPRNLLSIYFCAGSPTLEGTAQVIRTLERHGVGMIEIGIPFSDPMADGVVIQNAATQALRNGMSLRLLFEQLEEIRTDVRIPLVLMGYLNPILQYGFEAFCRQCQHCGIDGVIIPDLPFRDYQKQYRAIAERYDVRVIMLITPETSEARVREIDAHTDGFIYMVSSASTTGAQQEFGDGKRAYFKRIEEMKLKNPCMVGFGISNQATFDAACEHASGAIVGSRFVTLLNEEKDAERAITRLLNEVGRDQYL